MFVKMYKFIIMTPVKGIIIMHLALNQGLVKSICDTSVICLEQYIV